MTEPKDRTKNAREGRRPRRMRKRRRFWPWMLAIAIVAVALALVLFLSPFFRIKEVRIEGNTLVPNDEIMGQLGPMDTNLFLFPNDRARERLTAIDAISNVTFGRELPDRLVVRVEESYVLASIEREGQTLYLDDKGKVTDQYRAETNRIRPLALALEGTLPSVGESPFSDERPLAFLRALSVSPLAENVRKVQIDAAQNIDFMYNNLMIRFGPPNDIHRKLADAVAVVKEISTKGIRAEEILLDAGENPIVVTDDAQSEGLTSAPSQAKGEMEGEP